MSLRHAVLVAALSPLIASSESAAVCFNWSFDAPPPVAVAVPFPGARDFARAGNILYVASSSTNQGIIILDVTDPGDPQHIGFLNVGVDVVSLAATGTGLYAATGDNDLIVIDTSSPGSPVVVPWTGAISQSVAAEGTRLYSIRNGLFLDVYDVSVPTAPSLLGANPRPWAPDGEDSGWQWWLVRAEPSGPNEVVLHAGRSWNFGPGSPDELVTIVDTSDPADVDFFAPGSMGIESNEQCGFTYHGWSNSGRTTIASIFGGGCADLRATVRVSDLSGTSGFASLADGTFPGGIMVWDSNRAFWSVGEATGDGFYEIDISDPSSPVFGPFLSTAERFDLLYRVGDYLYTEYLNIFNVGSGLPASTLLGTFELGTPPSGAIGLSLSGSLLYAVDGTDLSVVDVSDPALPTVLTSLSQPGAGAVQVVGDLAVTAGTELAAIDVSGPGAPTELGNLALASPSVAFAFSNATTVVMTDAASTLHVVDVSNPSVPTIVGTDANLGGIAIGSDLGRVYVLRDPNLLTIDVTTNPAIPDQLTRVRVNDATHLHADGGRAYVSTNDGVNYTVEIYNIDVSENQKPQHRSTIDLSDPVQDLRGVGDVLYVVTDPGATFIYDVSVLNSPELVGVYPGSFQGVAASTDLFVVTTAGTVSMLPAQCSAAAVASPMATARAPSSVRVWPNPTFARAGTTISFSASARGTYEVELFDVSGRRVTSLFSGWKEPGPHQVEWVGEDREGRVVPPGLYFVRLSGPHGVQMARITRLR